MPAARRMGATVVVLAVALVLGVTGSAQAHNGVGASFKGAAGRYTLYAYDGYPVPSGQLEYRLVLLDSATGEPAADVVPVITARLQGVATSGAQSAQVTVMNNVVLYDLPNPYPHDWAVTVALSGPRGRGRAAFAMHGRAPYVPPAVHQSNGSEGGSWLAGGIAAGAAVVATAAYLMLRRRRRGLGQF